MPYNTGPPLCAPSTSYTFSPTRNCCEYTTPQSGGKSAYGKLTYNSVTRACDNEWMYPDPDPTGLFRYHTNWSNPGTFAATTRMGDACAYDAGDFGVFFHYWDGCQCWRRAYFIGEKDTPLGCPSAGGMVAAGLPAPYFPLTTSTPGYRRNGCCREVYVWDCCDRYFNGDEGNPQPDFAPHNPSSCVPECTEPGCNFGWHWDPSISLCVSDEDNGADDLSDAYGPDGLRLRAWIDAGALRVDRLDNALPAAVSETVPVVGSNCSACSILIRRNGRVDLAYVESSTAKLRISEDSGRTWGVATTISTNFQDIVELVDETRSLKLCAMWREGSQQIFLSVASPSGAGWTYTTPVVIVSAAKRGFSLLRSGAGIYVLSYRDIFNTLKSVSCRSVSKTGAGTWS